MLGLPLGLGKANTIANALFDRAVRDHSISLRIFTALTLEVPKASSELDRRFMAPVAERLLNGYPPLEYAKAMHADTLPPNVEVDEFFFLAGRWLGSPKAQQNYISANYTHACRYLIERGVNVVAQLVAKRGAGANARFSLSCNTDTTLDLLEARRNRRANFILLAQVNSELPFMPGAGDLPADTFAHVLESAETDFPLFAPPKERIGVSEYAIGLHAARLVADGGTLQIGIGQEADAAVRSLILRHHDNAIFCQAVNRLTGNALPAPFDHRDPFSEGLYGVSEMFVDGFLELMKSGILKREVDGALLHAAFFLGTRGFYRELRQMSESDRARLQMTAVSFTNELYGDEALKAKQRVKARFVNNAMIATLLGAVVSDALEDGRVVSGVGGQYNFVAQAFALPDARSILTVKSTRQTRAGLQSNVLWRYGHATIPRHLRDVIVTEYGIADLRGKSDRDTIAAMLSVADARFQSDLLQAAKDAGKIEKAYDIPAACRDNTPERVERALKPLMESGHLQPYPFGTDFDETEQLLLSALEPLKTASTAALARLAARGVTARGSSDPARAALKRMGLENAATFQDRLYRAILLAALDS